VSLAVDVVNQIASEGRSTAATRVRTAIADAAQSLGRQVADATEQLALTLERPNATKREIAVAKGALADAVAGAIVVALDALGGNTSSLSLPITAKGELPEVSPGSATLVTSTGIVPVTPKVVNETVVVVKDPNSRFAMAFSVVQSDGQLAKVADTGVVSAAPEQQFMMTGTGFKPGSPVALWIFSNPRSLGGVTADANGNFSALVPVPDNLAPGDHTAQINGQAAKGGIKSLNVGMDVALEEQLPAEVAPDGARPVSLDVTVDFAPQSSALTKTEAERLARLARSLEGATSIEVTCTGYTQFGGRWWATVLSTRRAQTVCARLRSLGVRAEYRTLGLGRSRVVTHRRRAVALVVRYLRATPGTAR
jgi:outer membrane protein OmpA-like peptidoglycan-associated protein